MLELCEEVERDTHRQAYQTVIKKIGIGAPEMPASLVRQVAKKLFPERPVQVWTYGDDESFNFVQVDEGQVKKAADTITVDGVPPEVVKAYMKDQAGAFAALANRLLREGEFPKQ